MSRSRPMVIGVVAILALVLGGAAIAGAFGGSSRSPLVSKPRANEVPPSIERDFSVFRRPRRAGDESPNANAPTLPESGGNSSLSRHVGDTRSNLGVVVGNGAVCLQDDTSSDCASESVATSGHLVAYDVCAPGLPLDSVRLRSLVPDGVKSVSIVRDDSSSETIPIVDNGFTALVRGRVVRVDWTRDGVAGSEAVRYPANLHCRGS